MSGEESEKRLKSGSMENTASNQHSMPMGISRTDIPWQEQYRSILSNSQRYSNQKSAEIKKTQGRGAFAYLKKPQSFKGNLPSQLEVIPSDSSVVFTDMAKKEPSPKAAAFVEKRYELAVENRLRKTSQTSMDEDENIFETERVKGMIRERYSTNEDAHRTKSSFNRLSFKQPRQVRFGNHLQFSEVKPIKQIESPCPIQVSESQSQSDDDFNMFDRHPKSVLKSAFGAPSYTLQNILNASDIYKDYLNKRNDMAKSVRQSVGWRFNSSKYRNPIIPPDYFFKPVRVQFNKPDQYMAQESGSRNNSLCYVNKNRTRLYYWKGDQQMGTCDAKCGCLKLRPQLNIGYGTDYDPLSRRFYLFSNAASKIVVISETSLQKLADVTVQRSVKDPNIHVYHIKGRNFLLLLGGYVTHQKQTAQGNQYIEIFQMMTWQMGLQSKLIRLIIGRINPIVLMTGQGDNRKILILGGNNVGLIDGNDIDYTYQQQINQSTNMSGVMLHGQELLHLFDHDLQVNTQNLSIKIDHPGVLHSGAVIVVDRKCSLLVLPGRNCLYQMKIFEKEVNLIEGRSSMNLKLRSYQKRQIALRVDPSGSQGIVTHFIDDQGFLRRRGQVEAKAEQCICEIY